MHPISCETPQNMVLSPYKRYALMVKRSRRRPLTAESRVRFPMGVPKKALALASAFVLPPQGICNETFVSLLHAMRGEPVESRLTLAHKCIFVRYAITEGSSLPTIPYGGTKKSTRACECFCFTSTGNMQ